MRGRAELGGEHLRGVAICRAEVQSGQGRGRGEASGDVRVRAEVEEELEERKADDEAYRAERVELAREDAHCRENASARGEAPRNGITLTEERGEEEALDLDPLPAEPLDCEDGDIVPRHETKRGHDQIPEANLEQARPRAPALAVEPNLLKHDVLV